MALGTSIFLIAVGAILRFAVYYSVHGIAINVVGIILMIVGVLGLVLSFVMGAPFTPGYRGSERGESHSVMVDRTTGDTVEEHTYVDRGPRV